MPLQILAFASVGAFGVVLAVVGLYRDRSVDLWSASREERPLLFWWSVVFQLWIGLTCLGLAANRLFGHSAEPPDPSGDVAWFIAEMLRIPFLGVAILGVGTIVWWYRRLPPMVVDDDEEDEPTDGEDPDT